ncbi:helix-turn-helix transcriptional regulator [uncultured Bacteroides sp.]|jgi:DNA-binding protein|uniref:helix-turn-helix domain-containing protein n=1 Tax=uncultured Bacteroides sp. TaxID=162156 RepID=UPI002595988D|nr:helix-turn-helix transcriptional regulator [uncultured Bacteroides sp.]
MELRIKEIMSKRGVTSAWLAEKVGISKVAVSNIITGKSYPSLDTIKKIADALNVSIIKLIGEDNGNCRFYDSDVSGKYKCCFVLSSNVSNMNWNMSYAYTTQVAPIIGDILDFSAFHGLDDTIITDCGTKYFIVDKRILYPLPDNESSEYDIVLFISPYKQ